MRPRKVIGPDTGRRVVGFPGRPASGTALRSVERLREHPQSHELWIGVHLASAPENVRLERLATIAQGFTPRISLVPPDGLLLEVKGSLHLFGGVDGLMRTLEGECSRLGLEASLSLAPTPLAATVAARVENEFRVTNRAQLVGRFSQMPLTPLRWSADVVERLARMGVRTIGQVLRLPRAGFARRFGPVPLADLDRLTGRSADVRRQFHPRERFRRRRELLYELESSESLLGALTPLLADLGRFLRERQCGVMELECRFRHRHASATRCVLQLATPVADVERLKELLGERLNFLTLPEPVRACELRSSLPEKRVLESKSLWQSGEYGGAPGAEAPELIERLRARLGPQAVYGIQMLAAHRPESAWSTAVPSRKPTSIRPPWAPFRRPLWLLPNPQVLDAHDGVPHRRGALRLLGDVERIETGWWDGIDATRDYYRAHDIHGVMLWIYRERAEPHRWFLHGVFG